MNHACTKRDLKKHTFHGGGGNYNIIQAIIQSLLPHEFTLGFLTKNLQTNHIMTQSSSQVQNEKNICYIIPNRCC